MQDDKIAQFGPRKFQLREGLIFEKGIGRLLTVSELAEVLQCSKGTIRNLVWQGKIPTVRPTPRMVRFSSEVIRRWLSERSQQYG